MKKFKIVLLALMFTFAMVFVAACKDDKKDLVEYTITFNTDGGSAIEAQKVEKDKTATKPADPTKAEYRFVGWYKSSAFTHEFDFATLITEDTTIYAKWDKSQFTIKFNTNGGSTIADQKVNKNAKVTEPTAPTKGALEFRGWFKDEALTQAFDFNTEVTADFTLYAKFIDPLQPEEITNTLDISKMTVSTLSSEYVQGVFKVSSGAVVEAASSKTATDGTAFPNSKAIKMAASDSLTITVFGEGKIILYLACGSSNYGTSTDKKAPMYISKDGGEKVESNYYAEGSSGPIARNEIDVEAGVYVITFAASTRVWQAKTVCMVLPGTVDGFEIAAEGIVDYLKGSELDLSQLSVNKTYNTGKRVALTLEELTIDSSNFDKNTAGEYTISISFGEYEAQQLKVRVFATDTITLGNLALASSASNKWGNGVLATNSLRQVFLAGEDFNSNNLTVISNAKCGTATKQFIIPVGSYEVNSESFSKTVAGNYTITVTYDGKSNTFVVSTVTAEVSEVSGVVQVRVDKDYTGVIGAIADGFNNFKTITSAIQFLENSDITDGTPIHIFVCDGTYNEKIDITLPNVTIEGESAKNTIITFDAVNGKTDARGTAFGTDNSATVSIRDTATNFTALNITFENYYNTKARYDALTVSTKQGEALIVQADQARFYNVVLTGYQDTIQLQGAGRSYFNNCLIVGATDFIFGTNPSALFEKCEIRTIGSGSTSNGGYITAFKGINKGADETAYGIIFNDCDFTCDAATATGKTALGRSWAAYSVVTTMNSRMGRHISKDAFTDGTTQGQRYVAWSTTTNFPTESTIFYQEYNNTGAGAIASAIRGMRMLTQVQAEDLLEDFYKAYFVQVGTSETKFEFEAWTFTNPTIVNPMTLAATYVVTFNVDGGSDVDSQTVPYGNLVGKPTDPTKTDKVFGGWYSDEDCTKAWNFASGIINEATTLYAKWDEPKTGEWAPTAFLYNFTDASEVAAITSDQNVQVNNATIFTIVGVTGSKQKIDTSSKSATHPVSNTSVSFTKRYNTQGAMVTTSGSEDKGIKFTTNIAGKLYVAAASSSTADARNSVLYNCATGATVTGSADVATAPTFITINIADAGTYMFGASGGAYIYYVEFVPTERTTFVYNFTDASEVAAITSDQNVQVNNATIFTIVGVTGSKQKIDTSSKSATHPVSNTSVSFTKRYNTQGAMVTTSGSEDKGIKFTTNAPGKLYVAVASSSGTDARNSVLYNCATGATVTGSADVATSPTFLTINIADAGTYMFGASGGAYIYYVEFVPVA